MRPFILRQGLLISLLATCLALPAAAAGRGTATHTPAVQSHATRWADAFASIGRIFTGLFAPEGSSLDPDGKARLLAPEGSSLDPNGKPQQAPGGTTPLPPGVTAPTSSVTPSTAD